MPLLGDRDPKVMGTWWPDPMDDIPEIPPKGFWGRLFDTERKREFRRYRELSRRQYAQAVRYHRYPKCAVILRAKRKLDHAEGRMRGFYVDSAEGTRCTCWRLKFTPDEWKVEQQRAIEGLREMLEERQARK